MIKRISMIFVFLFVFTPFLALAQEQERQVVIFQAPVINIDLGVVHDQMQQLYTNAPYLVKISGSGTGINPQTRQSGKVYYGGSGFVFIDNKERCGVVTNDHVLGPKLKTTAWVRFEGQKLAHKLRIVSRDSMFDLALLECPPSLPEGVRSAKLASSTEVGQITYAVGFPYGVRSVSWGVINAQESPFSAFSFINQTPLQPGNSGGPLVSFDEHGEDFVVGMNTRMSIKGLHSDTINIRYLEELLPRMWEGEKNIIHANLGIGIEEISDVNPDFYQDITNKRYSLLQQEERGLIVINVERGSAAGIGGIEVGDIVLGISRDKREVIFKNWQELFAEIALNLRPGDEVTIKTKRDGEIHNRTVTLGEHQVPQ